jgi:hypothetical protein
MEFTDLRQACMTLVDCNPNMSLSEIRRFVLGCMKLGVQEHQQRNASAKVNPFGPGRMAPNAMVRRSDVNGVPIEGDY